MQCSPLKGIFNLSAKWSTCFYVNADPCSIPKYPIHIPVKCIFLETSLFCLHFQVILYGIFMNTLDMDICYKTFPPSLWCMLMHCEALLWYCSISIAVQKYNLGRKKIKTGIFWCRLHQEMTSHLNAGIIQSIEYIALDVYSMANSLIQNCMYWWAQMHKSASDVTRNGNCNGWQTIAHDHFLSSFKHYSVPTAPNI